MNVPLTVGNIYITSGISLFTPPTLTYSTLPTLTTSQIGYNKTIVGNYPASATTVATGSFTFLINGGFTLSAGVYSITFGGIKNFQLFLNVQLYPLLYINK